MAGQPAASIATLLAVPKDLVRVTEVVRDAKYHRLTLSARVNAPGTPGKFVVFVRVHVDLAEDFSIGLRYSQPGDDDTVLLRVNGDHGRHRNPDGGMIAEGPHVHSFRASARGAPPVPGSVPKWAWPIPPEYGSLVTAWRLFCNLTAVTFKRAVEKKIAAIHRSGTQLELGGFLGKNRANG